MFGLLEGPIGDTHPVLGLRVMDARLHGRRILHERHGASTAETNDRSLAKYRSDVEALWELRCGTLPGFFPSILVSISSKAMRYHSLFSMFLLLVAAAGLSAACGSGEVPRTGTVADSTATPDFSTDASGSDIEFVLDDTYRVGEQVEVKIQNVGNATYVFNPLYQACGMSYTDASGREFIIPPGTHCDLVVFEEIHPGETRTLFSWGLDECVEDQWGCVKSEPLGPGTYRIRGEFHRPGRGGLADPANKTVAETTMTIIPADGR